MVSALQELQNFNHWVAWQFDDNNKKPPINPKNGRPALADNPDTWCSYSEAEHYVADNNLLWGQNGGLGFELGFGIAGIDLDNVIHQDTGHIDDWALDIVQAMDSYTEYSPSGTGLHILFKVSDFQALANELFGNKWGTKQGQKELYLARHYFTWTGNTYGEQKPLQERTKQLREVFNRFFTKDTKETVSRRSQGMIDWTYDPNPYTWGKMLSSKNGASIKALFDGDISGYQSQSEADAAMCAHLAHFTDCNPERMDSMFRETKLMRDKWDDLRGDKTYGQITIEKAISTYNQTLTTGQVPTPTPTPTPELSFDADYLQNSFQSDVEAFTAAPKLKTGFSNVDKFVTLFPGLYVVGGTTGSGKTTFCLQIADYLAQSGETVLYFAFEQSKFDLTCKSIARITAEENQKRLDDKPCSLPSAVDIRYGKFNEFTVKAQSIYSELSKRKATINCAPALEDVLNTTTAYMQATGKKPVVFLDYLQLLAANIHTKSTKEAIDFIVPTLKNFSVAHSLVIFLVSSFNRTNYLNIADFQSFKESGIVEYSADVVWALQLLGMNSDIFDTQSKLQTKRKFIRKCMTDIPRAMELVGLKNRFGISNARYFFDYFPKFDFFRPYSKSEQEAEKYFDAAFAAFIQENGGENDNAGNSKGKSKSRGKSKDDKHRF